jgi:hypothetical protein
MRTTMIELLTWTYRDELPKRDRLGYGDAWGAVEAYGDGGGYDVEPMPRLPAIVGAPHPDAETVAAAVSGLGAVGMLDASPEGLCAAREAAELLLGPIGRLLTEAELRALAGRSVHLPAALQSLALGVVRAPKREAWTPEAIRDGEGKVVQLGVEWRTVRVRIDGRTVFKRLMVCGWSPVRWAPQPSAVFEERLRWHVLLDAMEGLQQALASRLVLWRPDGLGLPLEPWRGDVDRRLAGRLLPDLAPSAPVNQSWRSLPRKRLRAGIRSNLGKNTKTQQVGA